jgi:hypothetical protein
MINWQADQWAKLVEECVDIGEEKIGRQRG